MNEYKRQELLDLVEELFEDERESILQHTTN